MAGLKRLLGAGVRTALVAISLLGASHALKADPSVNAARHIGAEVKEIYNNPNAPFDLSTLVANCKSFIDTTGLPDGLATLLGSVNSQSQKRAPYIYSREELPITSYHQDFLDTTTVFKSPSYKTVDNVSLNYPCVTINGTTSLTSLQARTDGTQHAAYIFPAPVPYKPDSVGIYTTNQFDQNGRTTHFNQVVHNNGTNVTAEQAIKFIYEWIQ